MIRRQPYLTPWLERIQNNVTKYETKREETRLQVHRKVEAKGWQRRGPVIEPFGSSL